MNRISLTRRMFLAGISMLAAFPLLRFVTARRYRPPVKVVVPGKLKSGQYIVERTFCLFMTGNGPVAVSRRCTHLGCIVNFHEQQEMFICPCHQSRFNRDGKYISGPAKKDLLIYKVKTLDANRGYVVLVT